MIHVPSKQKRNSLQMPPLEIRKAPDSYIITQTVFLESCHHKDSDFYLQQHIEKTCELPESYKIQSVEKDKKLIPVTLEGKKAEMVRVKIKLAPAGWYGSQLGYNKDDIGWLIPNIPFIREVRKNYSLYLTIPLPPVLPLDKPLLQTEEQEQKLKDITGMAIYNAGKHCIQVHVHTQTPPLTSFIRSLCFTTNNKKKELWYDTGMLRERITTAILEVKDTDKHYLWETFALYQDKYHTVEELLNLLLIKALASKNVSSTLSPKHAKLPKHGLATLCWDSFDTPHIALLQLTTRLDMFTHGMDMFLHILSVLCDHDESVMDITKSYLLVPERSFANEKRIRVNV